MTGCASPGLNLGGLKTGWAGTTTGRATVYRPVQAYESGHSFPVNTEL